MARRRSRSLSMRSLPFKSMSIRRSLSLINCYIEIVQKDSERSEWNIPTSSYDDLWNLDRDRTAAAASAAQSQAADAKRFSPRPEKDLTYSGGLAARHSIYASR